MTRKEKARAKVLRVDSILTKQPTSKKFRSVPGKKGPPTSAFLTKGAETPKAQGCVVGQIHGVGSEEEGCQRSGPSPLPRTFGNKEKVSARLCTSPRASLPWTTS